MEVALLLRQLFAEGNLDHTPPLPRFYDLGPQKPHQTLLLEANPYPLYHPAAALRTPEIEKTSYADVARIPMALLESRSRRPTLAGEQAAAEPVGVGASVAAVAALAAGETLPDAPQDSAPDITLF